MDRTFKIFLFSSVFLIAGLLNAQSFVQKFEGADCSLLVPDTLKYNKSTIETRVGKINYHTYFREHRIGKKEQSAVFQFSFCDYPSAMDMTSGLQDSLLIQTIHSSVKNIDGKLIYRDPVRIGTESGYIWRIHYNRGKAVMKSKAVFRGRRFYLIQVAAIKKSAIDDTVNAFMDSFEFL